MSKPRKAHFCDECEHFAPEPLTDDKPFVLCAKGHKPRLYEAGTYFGHFKRRCEDFKEDKPNANQPK